MRDVTWVYRGDDICVGTDGDMVCLRVFVKEKWFLIPLARDEAELVTGAIIEALEGADI